MQCRSRTEWLSGWICSVQFCFLKGGTRSCHFFGEIVERHSVKHRKSLEAGIDKSEKGYSSTKWYFYITAESNDSLHLNKSLIVPTDNQHETFAAFSSFKKKILAFRTAFYLCGWVSWLSPTPKTTEKFKSSFPAKKQGSDFCELVLGSFDKTQHSVKHRLLIQKVVHHFHPQNINAIWAHVIIIIYHNFTY